MLLAYVDESYTRDRYYIAALICDESAAKAITTTLDVLVRDACDGYPDVPPGAELHGHALFHGRDDWTSMAPLIRARIGIYESAMSALDRDGVRVILRGMDVARQRKKYRYPHSPHSVVLQHTLERINDLARDEQCNALVIADELPSQEDHRTELDTYRSLGTPGYRSSRLPRLLDTIHFAPSKYSRLLQAADLIAGSSQCRV